MNLFNRILVLLLALAGVAGGGGALLTMAGLLSPHLLSRLPGADDLAELTGAGRGRAILAATLALLASLALLLAEIWPRGRERGILLERSGLGAVTVALEGVRELASRAAAGVTGVRDARAQVTRDAKGVRVRCRVVVDPAAALPELTRALQESVKEAVEHHLGQKVTEVRVETRSTARAIGGGPSARRVR